MFNYDIERACMCLERVKTCSKLSNFSKNVVVYTERVIHLLDIVVLSLYCDSCFWSCWGTLSVTFWHHMYIFVELYRFKNINLVSDSSISSEHECWYLHIYFRLFTGMWRIGQMCVLQDQINEWANMTGFLCALGGVCLQRKSPSRPSSGLGLLPVPSLEPRKLANSSQDVQYCPVTQ